MNTFTVPPPARITSVTYPAPSNPDRGTTIDYAVARQHGIDPSVGRSWLFSSFGWGIPE